MAEFQQDYLTFYKHNIHANDIKKKEYIKVSQQIAIYMHGEEIRRIYDKSPNNNNNNNNKIWPHEQMVYAQPSSCPGE